METEKEKAPKEKVKAKEMETEKEEIKREEEEGDRDKGEIEREGDRDRDRDKEEAEEEEDGDREKSKEKEIAIETETEKKGEVKREGPHPLGASDHVSSCPLLILPLCFPSPPSLMFPLCSKLYATSCTVPSHVHCSQQNLFEMSLDVPSHTSFTINHTKLERTNKSNPSHLFKDWSPSFIRVCSKGLTSHQQKEVQFTLFLTEANIMDILCCLQSSQHHIAHNPFAIKSSFPSTSAIHKMPHHLYTSAFQDFCSHSP